MRIVVLALLTIMASFMEVLSGPLNDVAVAEDRELIRKYELLDPELMATCLGRLTRSMPSRVAGQEIVDVIETKCDSRVVSVEIRRFSECNPFAQVDSRRVDRVVFGFYEQKGFVAQYTLRDPNEINAFLLLGRAGKRRVTDRVYSLVRNSETPVQEITLGVLGTPGRGAIRAYFGEDLVQEIRPETDGTRGTKCSAGCCDAAENALLSLLLHGATAQ